MKKFFAVIFLICCFLVVYFLYSYNQPNTNASFPVEVTYEPGQSVTSFVDSLGSAQIISHKKAFRILLVLLRYDRKLKPNVYTFEKPMTLVQVVNKIGTDSSLARGVKVTIPEGSTVTEVKALVYEAFPKFAAKGKVSVFTKNDEGYLFPDTYYFSVNSTEEQIHNKLRSTFDEKTKELLGNMTDLEKKNAVIMASILEKEGRTEEERKVISGILWKRLKEGMPLQVDATFLYTSGKGSKDLTLDDLKTDNPYNTYTRKGLPIGPINNPGFQTLAAAVNPVSSPYYFYLHDNSGLVHYGKNLAEHNKNKYTFLK